MNAMIIAALTLTLVAPGGPLLTRVAHASSIQEAATKEAPSQRGEGVPSLPDSRTLVPPEMQLSPGGRGTALDRPAGRGTPARLPAPMLPESLRRFLPALLPLVGLDRAGESSPTGGTQTVPSIEQLDMIFGADRPREDAARPAAKRPAGRTADGKAGESSSRPRKDKRWVPERTLPRFQDPLLSQPAPSRW